MLELPIDKKRIVDALLAFVSLLTLVFFYGATTFSSLSPYVSYITSVSYGVIVLGALPLLLSIIENLRKGRFAVDIIALFALVTTALIGEHLASLVILLMISGGAYLEDYAAGRAKSALQKLLDTTPRRAHLKTTSGIHDVLTEEVPQGAELLIKPHEVIPLDGTVILGSSSINESLLTGEPIPRGVTVNDRVYGGTLNESGILHIRASSDYAHSKFAEIIKLVKKAEEEKAPLVRMADRYSVGFTLFTLGMSAVAYSVDPKLVASVLVVATPCPLLLAAPIAFIAGMSKSARKGIIVKQGGVFEVLTHTDTFFFDKTGTITEGAPTVERVFIEKKGVLNRDIVTYAASLEQFSTHILASSILNLAQREKLTLLPCTDIREELGKGITGVINGKTYILGSLSFLASKGVSVPSHSTELDTTIHRSGNVSMHIAEEEMLLGSIRFADKLRSDTKEILATLKAQSPQSNFVLVTGDNEARAKEVTRGLPFTEVAAECLPDKKVALIDKYMTDNKTTVMVGDGVNDSPALKSATVGIALGTHGETASTDAADAVIMSDDLHKLTELLSISKRTVTIAKESMVVGISLSVALMFLALLGGVPPLYGAILQETIDIVVIFNALRALA